MACLMALVVMAAGAAARAGEGYIAVSPSVNIVRITGEGADKRNIYDPAGAALPESSLFGKASDTDTALGVGISAGVSLSPRWQIGIGYDYIGGVDYQSRGALGYDMGGGMDYSGGYYTNRIGEFDFHTVHLQTRYNFLAEDCRFNMFATLRAGISFVRADMKADVYGNNGVGPMVYEYSQFRQSATKSAFSYGIGLGARYKFTEKISGEIAGEFFQVAGKKFTDYSGKTGALGGKLSVGLGIAF